MAAHYGYLKRSEGADGDQVDCFIGDHPESEAVFIVDQNKPDGTFDESKVMLGYRNAAEAKAAYLANYSAGWTGFRSITPLTIDQFKQWISDADTSKPAADRVRFIAKSLAPGRYTYFDGQESGECLIGDAEELRKALNAVPLFAEGLPFQVERTPSGCSSNAIRSFPTVPLKGACPRSLSASCVGDNDSEGILSKTRRWITLHPRGDSEPGIPVLIETDPSGKTGHVIGGLGEKSKGLNFLKLTHLRPKGETDESAKASKKQRDRQKRQDRAERLKRKAEEYAGSDKPTREHYKQARAHLKAEDKQDYDAQTQRIKAHVSKHAPALGMQNWAHNSASGISEGSHWRQAYRQLDKTYHRAKESLARDNELAQGVIDIAGQPMDYSDLLPDDAPAARGLGYQRTTRAEAAGASQVPEVAAVRNALDHSEDAGRSVAKQKIQELAHTFASSKMPSDQHYAGQLQEWLNKDFQDADGDDLLQKVEEAASERTASGLKTKRLALAPDPEREIQRDLKGMQSREARKAALEAAKKHKVQVGDQQFDAGTLSPFMRDHKKFHMEESDRRRGQNKGNLWGKGVHVDYTDMDVLPELVRDIHDEQVAARNESFLREVENVAKDPTKPNEPSKPGERLRQYLSEGTFHGLNYAASTVLGSATLGRRAVELLGVQGASELVANQIRRLAPDPAAVRQALVNWHEQDHAKAIDEAMREAKESQQQAEDITIPPIHSADDVPVAEELHRRRDALLSDAQAVYGRTLGELEATAALIHALGPSPTPAADAGDPISIDIPAGSAEAVARECHALGLTDDEFELQPGTGGKAKLLIHTTGQDKLATPPDPEQEALYNDIQAIKRGDHDEDDWLPPGFAKRDNVTPPGDPLPNLTTPAKIDLNGKDSPGMASQLRAYALAQYNNGQSQQQIIDDLTSEAFRKQNGLQGTENEQRADQFNDLLIEMFPQHDINPSEAARLARLPFIGPDGKIPEDQAQAAEQAVRSARQKALKQRAEAERENEKRVRRDSIPFAEQQGQTPALHGQAIDANDPHVHEAAFRALAAHPAGVAAWRAPGNLTHSDRTALRNHFWTNFARESKEYSEGKYLTRDGRHPGKDLEAFVRKHGGRDGAHKVIQDHMRATPIGSERQTTRTEKQAGFGFNDAGADQPPEYHGLANVDLSDATQSLSAMKEKLFTPTKDPETGKETQAPLAKYGNKELVQEALQGGANELKTKLVDVIKNRVNHEMENYFLTRMAGYSDADRDKFRSDQQEDYGNSWQRYVRTMGGEVPAYQSLQEDLRGDFLERFANHYRQLGGKPLKAEVTPLTYSKRHRKGYMNPDEIRAQGVDEAAEQRREMAVVASRAGGGFAHEGGTGVRKERAEQSKEAKQRQQGGLFGGDATEPEPEKPPEKSHEQARKFGARITLGQRLENQLAGVVPEVGRNFDAQSKGLAIYPSSMAGKNVLRQRMIKASMRAKRLGNFAGVGSGKTAVGVGLFTTLHDQGKVKRAIYSVPGQVQQQYHSDIHRFTDPGKYNFWSSPGASRSERLEAYRNPDNHMVVVTHAALRDDILHLLHQNGIVPGADESNISDTFNSATRDQRKAWVKQLTDKEGMDFGLSVVDEGHDLTRRRGSPGSTMANVIDALTDNSEFYSPQTATPVKNEPAEIHDFLSKIDPEKYNDSTEADFLRRYGSNTTGSAAALHREIAPYFYSEQIPSGVTRTDHVLDGLKLTPEQDAAYKQVDADYRRTAKAADSKNWTDDAVAAMKRLSPKSFDGVPEDQHQAIAERVGSSAFALSSLRDNGFAHVVDTHPNGVKMQKLMEIVRKERESGQPGVIFAHRRESIEQIRQALEAAGHRVAVHHGGMTQRDKDKARLGFSPETGEPDSDVLVVSDQGATGLNLQRASWLAQLDSPLTHKTYIQRQGRIDRTGQKNPVRFYDFVTDTGFERRARERLATKRDLSDVMQSSTATLDDSGLAYHLQMVRAETAASKPSLPRLESLPGVAA